MSKNQARKDAAKQLLLDYTGVTADWAASQLHCGRGQAADALRRARIELADEKHAMTFPTARNGWTYDCDPDDSIERLSSYVTFARHTATRIETETTVFVGASVSVVATTQDKRLARKAKQLLAISEAFTDAAEDLAGEIDAGVLSP